MSSVENAVFDFTPLGGNRPDCAVLMAAVVALVEEVESYLPPDVLDTALAMLCAPVVIINASSAMIPRPLGQGKGKLTCRLHPESMDDIQSFCNEWDGWYEVQRWHTEELPWRDFAEVCIESVKLPADIGSIECKNFFGGSPHIVELDLRGMSPHLTHLDVWALEKMTRIELPPSVMSVTDNCFCNCTMLRAIDLSSMQLNSVGSGLLQMCDQLTSVRLPNLLRSVGDDLLMTSAKLREVDFTNTQLSRVGNYCMYGCQELTSVRFPDSLESVGNRCLSECPMLRDIDFSNTHLKNVGSSLLFDCETLQSIRLPDSLESVENNFLAKCPQLCNVDLSNTQLKRVGMNFLAYSPPTTVRLPRTLPIQERNIIFATPSWCREKF